MVATVIVSVVIAYVLVLRGQVRQRKREQAVQVRRFQENSARMRINSGRMNTIRRLNHQWDRPAFEPDRSGYEKKGDNHGSTG